MTILVIILFINGSIITSSIESVECEKTAKAMNEGSDRMESYCINFTIND